MACPLFDIKPISEQQWININCTSGNKFKWNMNKKATIILKMSSTKWYQFVSVEYVSACCVIEPEQKTNKKQQHGNGQESNLVLALCHVSQSVSHHWISFQNRSGFQIQIYLYNVYTCVLKLRPQAVVNGEEPLFVRYIGGIEPGRILLRISKDIKWEL